MITATNGGGQRRSSSTTHGYQHGGQYPVIDTIQKFTFTSPSTITDVGNIGPTRSGEPGGSGLYASGGASAPDYGYVHGGVDGPGTIWDSIERYSFSVDGDAADVGELVHSSDNHGGTQN